LCRSPPTRSDAEHREWFDVSRKKAAAPSRTEGAFVFQPRPRSGAGDRPLTGRAIPLPPYRPELKASLNTTREIEDCIDAYWGIEYNRSLGTTLSANTPHPGACHITRIADYLLRCHLGDSRLFGLSTQPHHRERDPSADCAQGIPRAAATRSRIPWEVTEPEWTLEVTEQGVRDEQPGW
jgi:hypothetical protein